MSAAAVERAKRDAVLARRRLESTLGALQHRLRPGNLAGEAWDGVKEKSGDLADNAIGAVRKRPAIASAAVGAIALFLARGPLMRAVARVVSDDEGEDGEAEAARVTTRIETGDSRFNVSAPAADPAVTRGAS